MSNDAYVFDKRAVRRSFSAASEHYDGVAVLQAEVRQRLLERLSLFNLQPEVILDLGCGTALSSQTLQTQYSRAQVIAMDAAFGMLQSARPSRWWRGRKSFKRICADAYQLPLISNSVDLIFSNLMLQWCDPPDAVFAEVHRVLKPDGVFIFSSFGPDTLQELRNAWTNVDTHTHVNRFIDMHDIGDAMMRTGLSEPVLDIERFTLTYPDVTTLMRELKSIGAQNVMQGRRHGLMGRSVLNQVINNYERYRRDAVLPASYEVVYGQAWGNASVARAISGEVRVPVADIGRRSGQT
jgi:malonyl-CoA O-methyltransferase